MNGGVDDSSLAQSFSTPPADTHFHQRKRKKLFSGQFKPKIRLFWIIVMIGHFVGTRKISFRRFLRSWWLNDCHDDSIFSTE